MQYNKPSLTFDKQADLLIRRGLVSDNKRLIECLKNVNYYRLSGYLYPYRQSNDNFKTGTTFEKVWRHYTFDRRLRLIVMDAIERFEVSIKTQLIYELSHSYGAFGYASSDNFPKLSSKEHKRLTKTISEETDKSREKFVGHFKNKYGDKHKLLPLWMAGEIVSFGVALTILKGASDQIRKNISAHYGIPDAVLISWIQTINVIRNICAHHSRLWNREMGVKPFIPRKKKYPEWHTPVTITNHRIFGGVGVRSKLLTKHL
ncbi:Abi family protein [Patescibacteria group bacterium]|nr:Abi family protein [Patescibacteria group bacterium]